MLEKSVHLMSLIQSWIIYTAGLGGGGAGGTGCQMITGFSVSIFSMLSEPFSVRKEKVYHHVYH